MNNRKVKLIGAIPVDTGQIILVDPCNVTDDRYSGGEPTGGKYDETCRVTVIGEYGETTFGALAVATRGDGEFPVYAELDRDGKPLRLIVDLVGDGDYLVEGIKDEEDGE